MSDKDYKPFEPKPKEEKVGFIKRKEKWEKQEAVEDLSHRRFTQTLQVPQLVTAFKRTVHKNEISTKALITCYRVVLQKILQDPNLSDEEFISMYQQIQPRATEVYERRSRNMRKGLK